MEPQTDQPTVDMPIAIDHGHERISEASPAESEDTSSEFARHKEARGYTKPQKEPTDPESPPLPEAAAEPELDKKIERWQDPDTGDHYDMRHKVARRIKTVLEDRGKERARAERAEQRIEELTRELIARGQTPAKAEKHAERIVDADAEPDPADLTKYPEGQFTPAFIKDLSQWSARQATQGEIGKRDTQAQEHANRARQHHEITQWQQTLPEARKKYADFDTVLERVPDDPMIAQLMMQSPVGNDLVYVLGTQPKAMEVYQRESPQNRLRLLHHIEAQLLQGRPKATKPPSTTNAPMPTTPVDTAQGPAGPTDWSRTDDTDQYQRWKQLRQRR